MKNSTSDALKHIAWKMRMDFNSHERSTNNTSDPLHRACLFDNAAVLIECLLDENEELRKIIKNFKTR